MQETLEYTKTITWIKAANIEDFPKDGGACVKYKERQIAVFNFETRGKWYATQNMCPHKKQMALSRGMIGSTGDIPKVACPFHKKTFDLESGENLNGTEDSLETFPVKIENGVVYVGVPEE